MEDFVLNHLPDNILPVSYGKDHQISNGGIRALAEGLKHNTTLTTLDLCSKSEVTGDMRVINILLFPLI